MCFEWLLGSRLGEGLVDCAVSAVGKTSSEDAGRGE